MNPYQLTAIHAEGAIPFAPPQSEFTHRFWEGLRERRFLATHCDSCQRISFPPKPFCPHCWARSVRWRELLPRGIVYSATVVHAAPKVFQAQAPYHVCIVDLEEGVRIATRLLDAPKGLDVMGVPVELVVVEYDDGPLFAARVPASDSHKNHVPS